MEGDKITMWGSLGMLGGVLLRARMVLFKRKEMTIVGKKVNFDGRLKPIKSWLIGTESLVKEGETCLQSRAGRWNT